MINNRSTILFSYIKNTRDNCFKKSMKCLQLLNKLAGVNFQNSLKKFYNLFEPANVGQNRASFLRYGKNVIKNVH